MFLSGRTMYLCQGCDGLFGTVAAAMNCPNHIGPRIMPQATELPDENATVAVGPQQGIVGGVSELCWNHQTVALLINACIEAKVNSATCSKQQKQKQWEAVKSDFESQGYFVSDWEFLRKKWYRLVNKYKEVKDKSSRSGSGGATWEWYQLMDDVLGRDPNVKPIASLTTTPNGTKPLQVAQADSVVIGPVQGSTTGVSQENKRRKKSTDSTSQESCWLMDLEHRKQYREAKLEIAKKKLELLERLVNKHCE